LESLPQALCVFVFLLFVGISANNPLTRDNSPLRGKQRNKKYGARAPRL
jgi:hypothetical protein